MRLSFSFMLAGGMSLFCFIASVTCQAPADALALNPFQYYLGSWFSSSQDRLPSPEEWWRQATALGYKLKYWSDIELKHARKVAGDGVITFQKHVAEVTSAAQRLAAHTQSDHKQEIHDALSSVVESTLAEMYQTFPPPGEAKGHDERKADVERVLSMAREKIIRVLMAHTNVDEKTLRKDIDAVFLPLGKMLVLAGDLVEEHPVLAETFLFTGAMLLGALIPEWFILRPIIRLFGFGPLGPIKGTPAAWAQRYFWGAAVARGSWFAVLQRAGMIGIGWLSRLIGATFGGLVAAGSTWSCFGARQ